MTGRIVKYSEPVPFHKALPGAKSIVLWKRVDDGIPEGFTPPKRKKIPKVRNAHNEPIDDEIGKPAEKGNNMANYDYDTSRGPYHAILDKMARAHQAITGDSYAKSFTAVYTDPKNAAIRDGSKYDDLAKAFDSVHGTAHSLVKAAPALSYDPIRKHAELAEIRGPAHAKIHSLAIDHQRAHPGMSYQSAYGYLYSKPENVSLRNAIKSEHLRATMAGANGDGLDKAAPADAVQDDVSPGSANYDLHQLVVTRMKNNPRLSY